ncbi:MAG: ATP-binding protein [Desulfuromonadales bacterium]|jgi:serine/threonine-protein kinase RsbW|nr:ATP-binding protein [Desulfuromonadales bacterium]
MQDQISVDINIPNQTKYLGLIGRISENLAHAPIRFSGDRDELAFHLNLVLTEAATNAICHGNGEDPNKQLRITIVISESNLTLKVFDEGDGFDISAMADSEAKETDEEGRGIQLIYRLMDNVHYRRQGQGNVLEMTKYLR